MLRPELQSEHDRMAEHLWSTPRACVGRLGLGELLAYRLLQAHSHLSEGDRDKLRNCVSMNVGVSPPTDDVLRDFVHRYAEATRACTMMSRVDAAWFPDEAVFLRMCDAESLPYVRMSTLGIVHDFARHEQTWMRALDGQRVLVVHPFADTIRAQFSKGFAALFGDGHHMPKNMTLVTVKAPLTQRPADETDGKTWSEHMLELESAVAERKDDFDVALLACGGYGMPLCHYISGTLGKKAVYMGGVLQIMFGIRGNRWDARSDYTCLFNDEWVRPRVDERPREWAQIENGCYW